MRKVKVKFLSIFALTLIMPVSYAITAGIAKPHSTPEITEANKPILNYALDGNGVSTYNNSSTLDLTSSNESSTLTPVDSVLKNEASVGGSVNANTAVEGKTPSKKYKSKISKISGLPTEDDDNENEDDGEDEDYED